MAPTPVHLREERGGKAGRYFQRGRFLRIDEIQEELKNIKDKKACRDVTESLTMLKNIRDRREVPFMKTMRQSRARLTVSRLQHITGKSGFEGITQEKRFTGNPKDISSTEHPDKKCFSWWSVVPRRVDITSHKESAYKHLSVKNKRVSLEKKMKTKIKNQFSNSPLFEKRSRYGNFKFSFPVEDLLAAYRKQHCPTGGTLVFRVLGTWTYQQEILHAVLIHGSQCNYIFSNLPEINGELEETEESEEPVYRLQDGTFRCNLESSSNKFTLSLCPDRIEELKQASVPCVWNNPIFAFYLPPGTGLGMAISEENVEACRIMKPYMVSRGEPTPYPEAERLVQEYKNSLSRVNTA